MAVNITQIFAQTLATYLKPVEDLLEDPSISEVMINGPFEVFAERSGKLFLTPNKFEHEDHVFALAKNIAQFVGRTINEENPLLDARLPDGSRVHITLPPVSRKGLCISIRKFFREALTIEKLIGFGSITQEAADFLSVCVEADTNIVISGGTGSGKTSLLNVLSSMIPGDQRILVLEDSTELQLQKPHLLYYETRPPDRQGRGEITMRDLFRTAMRMRPDRVIIGEIRGGESIDLIQAMTSGHKGSMSTTHASSPLESLARLETLALMSDLDLPLWALRTQIANAIELIVQVSRFHDGSRKMTHISEALGLDDENRYRTRDLFVFKSTGRTEDGKILGELKPTGHLPTFTEQLKMMGLKLPPSMIERARARRAEIERRRAAKAAAAAAQG